MKIFEEVIVEKILTNLLEKFYKNFREIWYEILRNFANFWEHYFSQIFSRHGVITHF